MNLGSKWRVLVPFLAAYGAIGIAVILAYYPGLNGPFVFDDIPNILHNPGIRITGVNLSSLYTAAVSSPSNAMPRPLAGLSFAINYLVAGNFSSAWDFKLTNLVIHLINAALVYWFVLLIARQARERNPALTDIRWIPALTTAIWALHPINLTSVLYVVQRMTSISTLFVLVGMILFVLGRRRLHGHNQHALTLMAAGWFTGLVFGMGGKETAVLMLLYIPLVEYLFFTRDDLPETTRMHLRIFYALAFGLPLLLILGGVLLHPQFMYRGYDMRDFSMTERLLTEPRIICFYLYLLFVPNIAQFSLYHDDITVSTSAFTPWTTLPAIFALLALAAAAFRWRKKYPMFSFAVLWFLVGQSLESSFLPLELAHEHRNYLPSVGPVVGVTYALAIAFANRKRLYPVLCGAIALVLAFVTCLRAQTWATEETLITTMGREHPLSARTQSILAEFYAYRKGNLIEAQQHYESAVALAPNEIGYTIRMLINVARMSAMGYSGNGNKSHSRDQTAVIGIAITDRLHDRLEEYLSNRALTPTTQLALDSLATCISQAPFECRSLYPQALEWYKWVLENPAISRDTHKSVSIYLFQMMMSQKNYTAALDTAIKARSYDPPDISFLLMEADARMALRQFDKAQDILLHARDGSVALPPDSLKGIHVLLAKLQCMRASGPRQ